MSDDSDIDRLIASMAKGEPVDWEAARRRATTDADRARIDALQGVEQIAAFSHAQLAQFGSLLDRAVELQGPALESWLGRLEPAGAAGDTGSLEGAESRQTLAGETIGAYTLEAPIGEGGMGTVWLARRSDGRFQARVAVKLLHLRRVGRDGLARFEREGQILARLRHPNIAQLLDAGVTSEGQPYLVLEHVDGVSIDRYCDTRGLGIRERVELFLGVLGAVSHAQANLVLHRDLKPSNILVDQAGHVKLLDFGIAKLLEDETSPAAETELTQRAGHAFTPEFAAPEQFLGAPVTTATDVYAAGVVLYSLLTGRHPTGGGLRGASPVERMNAILERDPRPASAVVMERTPGAEEAWSAPETRAPGRLRRELRGDLDNILAKSLKKQPEERYPSAAAFSEDLRRYLDQEPVAARPDTITYRVGKFVRRHRGAVAGTSFAALALVAMTALAISQMLEARRQRDEARDQAQRAEGFNTVVTSLLSQVRPDGRALSPEELLDRAVEQMEVRYADDPAFQVDMLIRISGRYFDLRNTHKEYATLVRAEEIARRTGDPALIFRVQVNTVETELARGRKTEAQRRIEEARRLLPTLKQVPSVHDYLRAEAEVAKSNGDMPAAIEYLESARRNMRAEDRVHGNSYVGILSLLRYYNALAGNVRQAHEYALEWAGVEERHHRQGTSGSATSRAVLAASYFSLGEVARALAVFEEAFPEFKEASSGRAPVPSNTIGFGYGDILSRMGRRDAAIAMILGAVAAADRGGSLNYRIRSRLALGRALLGAGRTQEVQQPLDEAMTMMIPDDAANQPWLVEASRLRAEVHLAEKRLEDAAREAEGALGRLGYPERHDGPGLPQALLTLARVRLAQGKASQAAEAARAAIELFERDTIDPRRSADVGEAALELAQAQLAAGNAGAARKSLARATQSLRNGLGADHELLGQAELLAGPPHRD